MRRPSQAVVPPGGCAPWVRNSAVAAASRWARRRSRLTHCDFFQPLEPRRLLDATFNGTSGNDTIIIRAAAGVVSVTINGVEQTTTERTVSVNALAGADTVYFPRLEDPSIVKPRINVNLGEGDDYATNFRTTDNKGALSDIGFGPWLEGGNGNDTLGLDNTGGQGAACTFTRNGIDTYIQIGDDVATSPRLHYGSMNVVYDGSPGPDRVTLEYKDRSDALTINGRDGNDSVSVGNDESISPAHQGPVDFSQFGWEFGSTTLTGGAGSDRITFEDRRGAAEPGGYVLDNFTLTKGLFGFTYSAFETQELLPAQNNAVHVNATSGFVTSTSVRSFGGNPMDVGGGNLLNVSGNVELNMFSGTDELITLDNSGAGAGTTTAAEVFYDRVLHNGRTISTPGGYSRLSYLGGAGADTIQVHESSDFRPLDLDGGGGDDVFEVGAGSLAFIGGTITIAGGDHFDTVRISTALTSTFTEATLTANRISLAGGKILDYSTLEGIIFDLNAAGSRIDVQASGAGIFVNGGAGNDAVTLGGGNLEANLASGLRFEGLGGNDSLVIDDRTGTGAAYVFEVEESSGDDVLRKPRGGGRPDLRITAVGIPLRTLQANALDNLITVNDTSSLLQVFAGRGNDRVVVNDTRPGRLSIDTGIDAPAPGVPGDEVVINADFATTRDQPAAASLMATAADHIGRLTVNPRGIFQVPTGALLYLPALTGMTNLAGILDLTGGAVVVGGGAGLFNSFNQLVKGGYKDGAWNGTATAGSSLGAGAINSSLAASTPAGDGVALARASALFQSFPATFAGQSVNANDLLLRHTLYGDANLDRSVDFADLVKLAQNYNNPATAWPTGDFNFDNSTNFADLVALAQNYDALLPAPPAPAGGTPAAPARVAAQDRLSPLQPPSFVHTPRKRPTRSLF